ncbi:MAG: hypothetical protein ACW99A_17435 [Candidatus Kariarchaeaceae archaeon]|jgi:hypothetical protein
MIKITKNLITASIILLLGSIIAATSHWFAHVDQDFRFTIIGFTAAVFTGMYYGLSVEGNKLDPKPNNFVKN